MLVITVENKFFIHTVNVDKLYIPMNIDEHGMLQVHQTAEKENRALEEYLKMNCSWYTMKAYFHIAVYIIIYLIYMLHF